MRPFTSTSPLFAASLKGHDIIGRTHVKSVSNWLSPFCDQFARIMHDSTLFLPRAEPWPSAKVFAQLQIDGSVLLSSPKDKEVFEHCQIEKVMMNMGYVVDRAKHQSQPRRPPRETADGRLARRRPSRNASSTCVKVACNCADHADRSDCLMGVQLTPITPHMT